MNLLTPRSRTTPVQHEENGRIAGIQIEHWDDHVDASVFAPALIGGRGKVLEVWPDELWGLNEADRNAFLRGVGGGAFNAASGAYVPNFLDVWDATQLAFAFLADTIKMALYTNGIATMSYYADAVQTAAPYNANEASGTGYTAAGLTLANKTLTQSPNGTVMFDNTVDPAWTITGSFATAVRGAVVHDSTLSSALLWAINFGSDFNVTNGTFTVQLNSLGIYTNLFAA